MKHKKVRLFVLAILSLFFFFGFLTENTFACPPGQHEKYSSGSFKCTGTETGEFSIGANPNGGTATLEDYFVFAANSLAIVIMALSTLMTAYAGYLYASSEANPKKVEMAKNWIKLATVGAVMAALTKVILEVILAI